MFWGDSHDYPPQNHDIQPVPTGCSCSFVGLKIPTQRYRLYTARTACTWMTRISGILYLQDTRMDRLQVQDTCSCFRITKPCTSTCLLDLPMYRLYFDMSVCLEIPTLVHMCTSHCVHFELQIRLKTSTAWGGDVEGHVE